eukprot:CAMPEP_0117419962 /NCGR_PEP_ID=MMETSP0758-20121206/1420_1 /TAXON_ID=63605 /ORGANISM="Percolomonas cosmopolitus, Strain AE-1 (ATCC 50343)" /LENGTH=311 /DNA_ID=CAMNT_0005201343 /DNA_START=584 /DNA_END=1515 /DNA_ORIENTATION=+
MSSSFHVKRGSRSSLIKNPSNQEKKEKVEKSQKKRIANFHQSIINNELETAQKLLKEDDSLLISTDELGYSGLLRAVIASNYDIIDWILDTLTETMDMDTVKDYLNTPTTHSKRTVLHAACFQDNIALVNRLVDEFKVDCFVVDANEETSLHDAVSQGNKEIIQFLLNRHQELCDQKNIFGHYPLQHFIISNGSVATEEELQKYIKIYSLILTSSNPSTLEEQYFAADVTGNTIFHLAISHQRYAILEHLVPKIENHQDCLHRINDRGDTPISLLIKENESKWLMEFLSKVKTLSEDEIKMFRDYIELAAR